jgi:hypothetical protein
MKSIDDPENRGQITIYSNIRIYCDLTPVLYMKKSAIY